MLNIILINQTILKTIFFNNNQEYIENRKQLRICFKRIMELTNESFTQIEQILQQNILDVIHNAGPSKINYVMKQTIDLIKNDAPSEQFIADAINNYYDHVLNDLVYLIDNEKKFKLNKELRTTLIKYYSF